MNDRPMPLSRTDSSWHRIASSAAAAWLLHRALFGWIVRVLLLIVVTALLYAALRNVPLASIAAALARLQLWQVAAILGLDAVIYMLVTARWWLVVRAEARRVRFLPLLGARLSAFAVSYFTIGPQVGGEPLQMLYLRRSQGIGAARSTASVLLDKLFELLGNFVLLCFGLVAVLRSGILAGARLGSPALLGALLALLAWPLVHILMLRAGIYPLTALLGRSAYPGSRNRAARFIRVAERMAGQFCQRHPATLLGAVLVSLTAAAATVSEYALITSFLHIALPFWQLVAAWTIGWLSFLVPVPGGLGALEAGQVWSLGAFGVAAPNAVGLSLVMRGRDLLIGGVGLLFAANAARRAQIRFRLMQRT